QPRAALPRQIAPYPLRLDPQTVLKLRQEHDVHECPQYPCEEPARTYGAAFQNGEILTHDGHVPPIPVAERLGRRLAFDSRPENAAHKAPLLYRHLGNARQWMTVLRDCRRITDHEDVWVIRKVQEFIDHGPARAIRCNSQSFNDGGTLHARRPQ